MTKHPSIKRETQEPIQSASSPQSDASTEIIELDLEEMIQQWLQQATYLSNFIQVLTPSRRNQTILSIQKWIREEKKTGQIALHTHFLQSILSPPQTTIKKRKFQDSEQPEGEYIITADDTTLDETVTAESPEEKISYDREGEHTITADDTPLDEIATAESLEEKVPYGRKGEYLITKDNTPLDEIAIAESLEEKVPYGRKGEYLISKDNTPLNEIAIALKNASKSMQKARLVVRTRNVPIKNISESYTILRLPERALNYENIFGVVQNTKKAKFTLKANLYFNTHMEPFGFACNIIYNPVSDNCVLYNISGLSIYLTYNGNEMFIKEAEQIYAGGTKPMWPGSWRISASPDQTAEDLYPIFEVLVLPRRFNISSRIPVVQGSEMFPRESQEAQYESIAKASILDLADGETAYIEALSAGEKTTADTYDLQQIAKIATSKKTSVFSCRRSGIEVAAKVFCASKDKGLHLVSEDWNHEKDNLELLRHKNIISLAGFDSRCLVLYLRPVLPSLDMIENFTPFDTKAILRDMSYALAYLSEKKIVHYDIKPRNIIYSTVQGAVLIDFEMARFQPEPSDVRCKEPGGTPLFLPPEAIEPGEERGYPGDIWALGLTMLFTLRKIKYTRPYIRVFVGDFNEQGTGSNEWMKNWFEEIALQRSRLNKEDKVELLVSKMLETDIEARVTAAALKAQVTAAALKARVTAAALSEGGPSSKKQKHN